MVAESLTTRLAREWLAAIKKFTKLQDIVLNKLQQRQQVQTDFSVSSEHLYTPISKATKDMKHATERAIFGDIPEEGARREAYVIGVLEQIPSDTKKNTARDTTAFR